MMCASTVQVAAPPGEVVSNTGKQNRKVLAAPVMESFASITGVTTLLRQKHGNCPHPPIFLHSIPFSFVRRSNYRLPLIPSSDGSHACAAEMVRYREDAIMNPNINFYGIVILLRKLRECGIFTEKELRKIAARIAADNGVEVMFFL